MRRLALLAVASALVVSGAPAVAAPTPTPATGGVSVVPDARSTHLNSQRNSLRVNGLRPTQGFTDAVFVLNTTSKPLRLAIYPADGIPARGGGYGYSDRSATTTGVGSWLTLSTAQLTVPANGRVKVGLTLRVPAIATNGLNVGGVVAEPLDQANSGPIQSVTRYAMPVAVTIVGGAAPRGPTPTAGGTPAGPAPPVRLDQLRAEPDGDRLCPTVRIANGGGLPVQPKVQVQSDGTFSGGSRSRDVMVDAIPPIASRVVRLPCVKRPLGPGTLRVTADVPGGDAPVVSAHLLWLPLPVVLSLLFLLLLIGALVTTFVRDWLRRRRAEKTPNARLDDEK